MERLQNNIKVLGERSKEKVWAEEERKRCCVFQKKHFWAFALLAGDNQDPMCFVNQPISICSCLQPSSQALPHTRSAQPMFYLQAEISYVCSPLERKFFGEVWVKIVQPNPHLPSIKVGWILTHHKPLYTTHTVERSLERGFQCNSASDPTGTTLFGPLWYSKDRNMKPGKEEENSLITEILYNDLMEIHFDLAVFIQFRNHWGGLFFNSTVSVLSPISPVPAA